MRYAIKCIAKSGFVTYTYYCCAHLIEDVKYWAAQQHPDCTIEVAPE